MAGLFDEIAKALSSDQAQPSFPPRYGIDIVGPGITSPIMAAASMANEFAGGRGSSPAQLDQRQAMLGPLFGQMFRERPDLASQRQSPTYSYGAADRRSLAEDLNIPRVVFDNWRKQQTGQQLSPQERVMQGFVDMRNPNSIW